MVFDFEHFILNTPLQHTAAKQIFHGLPIISFNFISLKCTFVDITYLFFVAFSPYKMLIFLYPSGFKNIQYICNY